MTKKELLNKIEKQIEKQQEIIDALFRHLKLEYKEEEYIQKYSRKARLNQNCCIQPRI